MVQIPSACPEDIHYYFSKSKGTHTEAGEKYITLFARLSMEIPEGSANECKTVWVDIEEVKSEQAAPKIKKMSDSIFRYEISEELFLELYKISQRCSEELYCLTPLSYLHDYNKS